MNAPNRVYLEIYGQNYDNRIQIKGYLQQDYKAVVVTGWLDGVQLPEKTIAIW